MPTSRSERPEPVGAGHAGAAGRTDPLPADPTLPAALQGPYDLAVIGAGPAGLAGAVAAADLGLHCVLLDAGARAGGQYYRHPAPTLRAARPDRLHHRWATFAALADRLAAHVAAGRIDHLTHHHVWTVERGDRAAGPGDGWRLHAATGADCAGSARLSARAVLLATGAYERQLPFPGWTLPGVVTAGGAQAMLKAGLVLPGRRVVVAGSGPLLLAAAVSLAAAGAEVPAVVEASTYLGYARRPGVLAAVPGKLIEGAVHGAALLRHGVRLHRACAVVEAHGTDRVTAVTLARLDATWRPVPGTERRIACDAVAVGHGLVPQIELATELGAAARVVPDGTVALRVDDRQRTSVPRLWAAGETCGVGGAELALAEGELAAQAIAEALASPAAPLPAPPGGAAPATAPVGVVRAVASPAERSDPRSDQWPGPPPVAPPVLSSAALLGRRRRLRAFAELMATAHRPGPGWTGWLRPQTEVCRCEEVPVAAVREAVDELGAADARTVKLLTRAGMGWCQGRMCGPAVTLLSGAAEPAVDSRPLSCPVRLGELAADRS